MSKTRTVYIDYDSIMEHDPCTGRAANYLAHYGRAAYSLAHFFSLTNISVTDKLWVVSRMLPERKRAAVVDALLKALISRHLPSKRDSAIAYRQYIEHKLGKRDLDATVARYPFWWRARYILSAANVYASYRCNSSLQGLLHRFYAVEHFPCDEMFEIIRRHWEATGEKAHAKRGSKKRTKRVSAYPRKATKRRDGMARGLRAKRA